MVQVDEPDMEKQRRWQRRTQSKHQLIPLNNAQAKGESIQPKNIDLEAKLALN
jgi:ribosomal protein L32